MIVLQIGSPPQLVHLLPATSQSSIWPVDYRGCSANSPVGCSDSRGRLFNYSASTSWQNVSCGGDSGIRSDNLCQLPFSVGESLVGYNVTALTGMDTVKLGIDNAPSLSKQVVATYAVREPLVGLFGLSNYSTHVNSAIDADLTVLQALKQDNIIPARYYGYTAGASYATGLPQYGSLTLGGYDEVRFDVSHHLEFPLGGDSTRDLAVAIRGITIGVGSGSTHVELEENTFANIDSLVPEIWLPQAAC